MDKFVENDQNVDFWGKCKTVTPIIFSFYWESQLNILPAKLKALLRQEIQYQKLTHPLDAEARKDLYKVNSLSESDMIENLTLMFGEEENLTIAEAIIFPGEDEIVDILTATVTPSKMKK